MEPRRAVWLVGAALLAVTGLAGRGSDTASGGQSDITQGIAVSRSELYESLDQLDADSSLVAVGEVVDQDVQGSTGSGVAPDSSATVSTFRLDRVRRGADAVAAGLILPEVGSTIEVRQLGTDEPGTAPAPILEVGSGYLLFLTPTGLAGGDGAQYYVTGGTAGYYAAQSGASHTAGTIFTKVGDEGDVLPDTLTEDEVR